MVISLSVSFWPKKVKSGNFEGDCVPNGSTGKVATWDVKYDAFRQNAEFFKEIELISFKSTTSQQILFENIHENIKTYCPFLF